VIVVEASVAVDYRLGLAGLERLAARFGAAEKSPYAALAEALGAPLVTAHAAPAGARGHAATVELYR
jgi:hypothetical protein